MPAVRIKDHWREQRLFDQRSIICAVIMALATLGLVARLYVLQVSRHAYYSELSQGNRVRTEPIPAARGLILDRAGEVIAGNQPAYQLELVPEEVPDVDGTLASLVQLGLIRAEDVAELERTIDSSRSFDSVPIRLRMSDEDVARFAVRRFEFPGLDIRTRISHAWKCSTSLRALGFATAEFSKSPIRSHYTEAHQKKRSTTRSCICTTCMTWSRSPTPSGISCPASSGI